MHDMTAFDNCVLTELMVMYHNGYHKYKTYPDQLPPKKQSKVRRDLEKKFQNNFSDFPEEIKTYLKNCTDSEFFDFLKNGIEERNRRAQIKRDKETGKFASFGDEVKSIIWEIMHGIPEYMVEPADDSLKIEVRSLRAYSMYLILYGVSETSTITDQIKAYDMKFEYSEDEKEFYVTGKVFLPSDENSSDFRITFTSAEIESRAYNPFGMIGSGPWADLMSVCDAIYMKYESAPYLLNDKEKELLPYILGVGGPYIAAKGKATYTTLLKLAHKYGHRKTEKILARLANSNVKQRERSKAFVKLMLELNRISHIKMWREIYDTIYDTQKGYPTKIEFATDGAELAAKRECISEMMADKGYSGTYPYFVKGGKIGAIRMFESYGQLYTAMFEKRMQSRVYFAESSFGEPMITVISGCAFLKKNENDDDFFSFLFNARGRRYFAGSSAESLAEEQNLKTMIEIAAKKAEFEKLTKEERAHHTSSFPWGLLIFILIFSIIVGGGLFFIGMTLFSFLIEVIPQGFTAEAISEFFKTDWLLYLAAMSFLGFGGLFGLIFGILTCLARRK